MPASQAEIDSSTEDATAPARVAADPELFELMAPEDARGAIRLLASHSPANGETYWPRRRRCPVTRQPVEDVVLDANGSLWSWTYVSLPWPVAEASPSPSPGYGVGVIEVPEGPRVLGLLVGDHGDWKIGDQVEGIAWDLMAADDVMKCIPAFRLVRDSS